MTIRRAFGAPLLRGALIGGTAYAVGRSQGRRAEEAHHHLEHAQHGQAQSEDDLMEKLGRLADMAKQGVLTPEEFSVAKAKLLGQ